MRCHLPAAATICKPRCCCPSNCQPGATKELLTGRCAIVNDGAFIPGQGILKGFKEVEDAPSNDHVVVETNKKTDLGRENNMMFKSHVMHPPDRLYTVQETLELREQLASQVMVIRVRSTVPWLWKASVALSRPLSWIFMESKRAAWVASSSVRADPNGWSWKLEKSILRKRRK